MNIAMNNGRHQADRQGWWQRRSKKGKVGILVAGLFLVGTLAWAATLLTVGMTSNTFSFTVDEDVTVTLTEVAQTNGCTATIAADGQSFNIDTYDGHDSEGFQPGAACDIILGATATSNGPDVYLVDLIIDNSDDTASVTGEVNNCPDQLTADGTTVNGLSLSFVVDSETASGTHSWQLSGADSMVFADSTTDGNCTSAS